MKRGSHDYLTPDEITTVIHRVCIKDEPIKAVEIDLGLHRKTVCKWVRKYERREVRSEQAMQS